MELKNFLKKLEKYRLVSKKPKSMYIFLLFFSYLLIWLLSLTYYLKFEYEILKPWVIIIGILTFLTLVHAITHKFVIQILEKGR